MSQNQAFSRFFHPLRFRNSRNKGIKTHGIPLILFQSIFYGPISTPILTIFCRPGLLDPLPFWIWTPGIKCQPGAAGKYNYVDLSDQQLKCRPQTAPLVRELSPIGSKGTFGLRNPLMLTVPNLPKYLLHDRAFSVSPWNSNHLLQKPRNLQKFRNNSD